MSVSLLILGLVLFIMLVVVHEMGHFWVARWSGVKAEEFGIFFPPRLWSKKMKKGWTFSINALPLGGFVRLKGERDTDTSPHSYGAAKLGAKAKILLAGVAMNMLAAFLILMILAWVGMPKLLDNQFTVKSDTHTIKNETLAGYILPGSPAAKAGLKSTDELMSIGVPGQKFTPIVNSGKLPTITEKYAGQKVEVVYLRGGQSANVTVTLLSKKVVQDSQNSNNPKGYLGVSPAQYTLTRSGWSAPVIAGGLIGQFTGLTFQGLGHAIAGLGSTIAGAVTGNSTARHHGQTEASVVSGPVGVYKILEYESFLGYQFVLLIIAVISLSLAIMNVLPIPPLDGSKLFMTLIAHSMHKKLTEKVEGLAYGAGFAVLFALLILITIVDVQRKL